MITKEEGQLIVVPKDNFQHRPSPDSTDHASHTDREENSPIVPEKPSEDGYNWRKYGQKNVKGNEYIRSYYKCSYPNCQVKKQVERSRDGRITDITYLGQHDHAKPHSETHEAVPSLLSVQVQIPDCPPSTLEDNTSNAHVPTTDTVEPQPMDMCELPTVDMRDTIKRSALPASNQARDVHNENITPKKRKKSVDGADIITEKPTLESRLVVQTVSDVDIVNDGYRWRKYGQKMVKGNPNPRSYYRCSTAGCPVKKHVERASYDPKVVITTYEGQHDHSIPPIRTVVPQSEAPSGAAMELNGVNKSWSQEGDGAQNGSTVGEAEKSDAINPTAKEEIKTKDLGKTELEISPNEQKAQFDAKRSDQIEQIKHDITSSEQPMQVVKDMVKTEPEISPSERRTESEAKTSDQVEQIKHEITNSEQQMQMIKDVMKNEPEISPSEQRTEPEDKRDDQIEQIKHEITGSDRDDSMSTALISDNVDDQSAKQVALVPQTKTEAVLTEQQKPDAVVDKSNIETKSNGQQRPSSEPVNC